MSANVLDEVIGILRQCSRDELAAFAVIARKVMGPGRVAYGPTDLTVDRRKFRREAADEITDAVWYWALDTVRRQMVSRPRVDAFIEAAFDFSDEPTSEWNVESRQNRTGEICADCGTPAEATHAVGCPWTVAVL